MNILFLHRDFPAQFKNLATKLASETKNQVMFMTNNGTDQISGVKKLVYKITKEVPADCHPYLREHEEALLHAQAAAALALEMRKQNVKLDVIYTQPFGPGLFMKYIFPDVPLIYCCEWFNRTEGVDIGFEGSVVDVDFKAKTRCSNSNTLIDLYSSDACIAPFEWQKKQFPDGFQDKIKVIPDGIDSEAYKPKTDAKFIFKEENLELTQKDEVIAYSTYGLDPYRGLPQFMQAIELLQAKRPNARFIIFKEDEPFYKMPLGIETTQGCDLSKYNLDMNRVHFVGSLPLASQIALLQISSVFVFLTYPHILSKTILEAMSIGCCIIASNTQPVLEFIKDGQNGLLVDFFDCKQLAEKTQYVLENPQITQNLKQNARKTIIENYELEKILPKQINFINNLLTPNKLKD